MKWREPEPTLLTGVRDPRLRIKPGWSTPIAFLDEDPFIVREHVLGRGPETMYLTCPGPSEPDRPCCRLLDDAPRSVGYFTVVASYHIPWMPPERRLRLFRAPQQILRILRTEQERHGGLVGVEYEVHRDGPTDPICGSRFERGEQVDLIQLARDAAIALTPLSEVLDEAAKSEFDALRVSNTLRLTADEPRRVATFNYEYLLRPLDSAEMEETIVRAAREVEGVVLRDRTPF